MAAGRFVPNVEQRIDASFTAAGASESLFVIGIDNCQADTIGHRVLAIFPTGALTAPAKATLRWDEHDVGGSRAVFVAVLQEPGKPARLIDASGRVIALNPDFVSAAPGAAHGKLAPQGSEPAVEPWKEIARVAPPPGCFAFTVPPQHDGAGDALDPAGTAIVHVKPCGTP